MPMDALSTHLDALGVGRVHASRVFRGLHVRGLPLAQIPDLGRHARTIAEGSWIASAEIERAEDAGDGTYKLVLRMEDGARVESVIVPMREDRSTLCVSTQVGCAMACAFCATGTMGLARSLKAGEVVAQIAASRAWAASVGRPVTRLVYMGMGEPLHAYDATSASLRVLLSSHGISFGSRNVTVSTVGLPGRIERFADDFRGRVQLAISLHAGTDATRAKIVPAAKAMSLADLRAAVDRVPSPKNRKLMVEYVVLPGVNDTEAELDGVAAWMDGVAGVVNLIPFNPFGGAPFRSPAEDEVVALNRGLRARGVVSTIRWPRGRGAHGACGQLALSAGGSTVQEQRPG
jgi:23S rRNA (adenine2503-C2)-methyltransferase